jgi:hypothetical protein
LRRLAVKNAGDFVSLPQRDGTTKKFEAEPFWLGLFCAQADAAAGVVPTGPVPDAVNNATPETRARLERMAASGDAGSFMRRAVVECGGLLAVADDTPDLSE